MFYEKRKNRRRYLTGLLPGKITFFEQDQNIACQPVDISPEGLGILTNLVMKAGTQVELHTKGRRILLEVSWGQPDFAKSDLYRYGLKVLSPGIDLEALFAESGCLK